MAATFFGHEQVRDLALDSCAHNRPQFGQRLRPRDIRHVISRL
jgi:hypothetical protein